MEQNVFNQEGFIKKILRGVDKFYNSDFFMVFYAIVVYLSWFFENEYIAVVSTIAILCYMFLTQQSLDRIVMIAIVIPAFVDNNMRYRISYSQIYILVPLLLMVVGCAIFHFIKVHKPNGKKISKSSLFWGYLIVVLAGVVGGLGYPGQTLFKILIAVSVGLALLGLYCLIYKCTTNESKNTVFKSIVLLCVVIIAQMITFFLRTEELAVALTYKTMSLGWAITNSVAVILAMGIPLCFYLAKEHKFQFAYMLLASVFYAFIFITHSRSMMIVGSVIYFICLILSFVKLNKWQSLAHLLLVVGVGLYISINYFDKVFEQFIRIGLDANGRTELYTYYWGKFKENIWFGIGFYNDTMYQTDGMVRVHNTILQILTSTGIIGALTFIPMYYQRYKSFLTKISWFKVFSIISYLAFVGYGLVDCAIISSYKLIIVYLLLFAVECDTHEVKDKRLEPCK